MQNKFIPNENVNDMKILIKIGIVDDEKTGNSHVAILYPDNIVEHWQKSFTRAELIDFGQYVCKALIGSLETFHDRKNLMRDAKAEYEKEIN